MIVVTRKLGRFVIHRFNEIIKKKNVFNPQGILEGYNCTVFAYGQTGCGKSFSMQGIDSPPNQRGIIPRAFEHVFEAISVTDDVKFLVLASYIEIYNEEVRDLLSSDTKRRLELKESPDRGVYVNGKSQRLKSHTYNNVTSV